ncbi:MAG: MarR family transcriptional regulator [Solirubrobacteraceae bacterium]|nr:MarR family transcriptional regulator [Solirubrobacteraceae bacterium]
MPDPAPADLAFDLRSAVGVLVRRFRQDRTLPAPQMAAISWLFRKGPQTTSGLAALERMRPQSMATTVAQLEQTGLAIRRPDEHDGRKLLIELTDAGRAAHQQYLDTGESWVAEAIEQRLTVDERVELARGLELIGRLVDE